MSTQYVLIFTQIDSFTVHLWKFTCFLENRSRVVKSVHTWTLILSISVLFLFFFFLGREGVMYLTLFWFR